MNPPTDVIDQLVGIPPGSHLDTVRALRPEARANAQNSFLSLFAPTDPGDVTLHERHALAAFVAGLHDNAAISAFYAAGLAGQDILAAAVAAEAKRGAAKGPYGTYASAAMSAENTPGLAYHVSAENRSVLGAKIAAALEHVHMLVLHPRDASVRALQALLEAGWSTTGIVTISQLVAFLSFQIRVITGLRALAAAA